MSACVVPVAPNFQDPPVSEPNIAPYMVTATPDFGSYVAIGNTQDFMVTVTDQNVGDDLSFQWVVDYPPYTENTRLGTAGFSPHSVNGTPQMALTKQEPPPCGLNLEPTIAVHQLELIAADREFDQTDPKVLNALKGSDGLVVHANWTFSCQ